LELIYRPKYGTLKAVLLFEELPDEPKPAGAAAGGCCFRLVQTHQPFRLIGDFTADSTQPADNQGGFAGFFDSIAETASLTNY
jgi:hypothetical protein